MLLGSSGNQDRNSAALKASKKRSKRSKKSVIAATPRSENEDEVTGDRSSGDEGQEFQNPPEDSAIDLITQLLNQQQMSGKNFENMLSNKDSKDSDPTEKHL